MANHETFQVIKLIQSLSNSLLGSKNIYDPQYIEDVEKRLPKIEKAFNDLKNHFNSK